MKRVIQKDNAVITEIDGVVVGINEGRDRQHEIVVQGQLETRTYNAPYTARLKVAINDQVERGQELTEGSIDPKELIKVKDVMCCSRILAARSSKSISYARC